MRVAGVTPFQDTDYTATGFSLGRTIVFFAVVFLVLYGFNRWSRH